MGQRVWVQEGEGSGWGCRLWGGVGNERFRVQEGVQGWGNGLGSGMRALAGSVGSGVGLRMKGGCRSPD